MRDKMARVQHGLCFTYFLLNLFFKSAKLALKKTHSKIEENTGERNRRKTEKNSRGFVTPVQILTEPDSK